MHAAICDDELRDLTEIKLLVQQYDISHQIQLDCFESAIDLYHAAQTVAYDFVILDIEMPAPNGYEVAKQLKKIKPDVLIVFATNSIAYTIKGYGVAFRYLLKPLTYQDMHTVLNAIIDEVNANRFLFSAEGTNYALPLKEIFYFEVYRHHTTLHTENDEFRIRTSMKDITEQLPLGRFASPHVSFLVNLEYVRSISANEIVLCNGHTIPISRRKQKTFEHMLEQYIGR